jgi:hypothetical protein
MSKSLFQVLYPDFETLNINSDTLNRACTLFDPGFETASGINRFRRQSMAFHWLNIWAQIFPQIQRVVNHSESLELQKHPSTALLHELLYRISKLYNNQEDITTNDIEGLCHLTDALLAIQKQTAPKNPFSLGK